MQTEMRDKQRAERQPGVGSGPLPAEPCVSRERLARQRGQLPRRCRTHAGRIEEVLDIGDHFVRDIAVRGASVPIIRGSDGMVRGFHNLRSHRSNTLVSDGRGRVPAGPSATVTTGYAATPGNGSGSQAKGISSISTSVNMD